MEADQTNLSSPQDYDNQNEDFVNQENDVQMQYNLEGEIIDMNSSSKGEIQYQLQRLQGLKPEGKDISDKMMDYKTKKSSLPSSDTSKFIVKPRFDEKVLVQGLRTKIVNFIQKSIKQEPIEVFEVMLYQLNKKFNNEMQGQDISFSCLDDIHHIIQLKRNEDELDPKSVDDLNRNLDNVLQTNPSVLIEYNLFKDCIELFSALLIKWKLVSVDSYSYRMTGRGLNVKMLDLEVMNQNIFTLETMWFSIMAHNPPLNRYLDDTIRQYAYLLQRITLDTMHYMLRMNDVDFRIYPSIEGLIAAKKPKLQALKGYQPDYHAEVIEYQRLKQPTGCIAKCFKTPGQAKAVRLQEMLMDMEMAYRSFERSLVGYMLVAVGKNDRL